MKRIYIDPSNIDDSLIKEAADMIKQGAIVALPTETVYGLAGRCDKSNVIDRLYAVKQRSKDKPFTCAIGDINSVLNSVFSILPPFGYRLIEKFWPGPLTLIYYSTDDKKIGVRVPSNIVTSDILVTAGVGVYMPSANISGHKEAVSADEVEAELGDSIDMIVDTKCCEYSRPSTVIDLTTNPFGLMREGAISEAEIVGVFARKRILFVCTGNTCRSPMAQFLLGKYLFKTKPYAYQRYEVISRGISAFEGMPISPSVSRILEHEEDVKVEGFYSRKLDRFTILSSDYIFTMEDDQRKYVLNIEPAAEGRVFNLGKFLPIEICEQDISDPAGRGDEAYETAYNMLREAIIELNEWL